RARLLARDTRGGYDRVCTRGLTRDRIREHSIRRFACKSSFSETSADAQSLRPDDSEVTREVARRLSAGGCPPGGAFRIAAGQARRRVGRAAESGWVPRPRSR